MEDKKYICKYCGKSFETKYSLGAHVINCKCNPNNHIKDFCERKLNKKENSNPILEYNLRCTICGSEYTIRTRKKSFEKGIYKHTCSRHCASILTGINTNKTEKNKKISENSKCYSPIKNKHFENEKWVENTEEYNKKNRIYYRDSLYKKAVCEVCKKEFEVLPNRNNRFTNTRFCSKDCLSIFYSNLAKKHNFGGKNNYSKYHRGWYKGIYCDSSWELAYLVHCIEHDIPIKRCNTRFSYLDENNKNRIYTPDFIVEDQIIEIKGYFSKNSKLKTEQVKNVKILFYKDIKPILDEIISKYGKKFWEVLYDK